MNADEIKNDDDRYRSLATICFFIKGPYEVTREDKMYLRNRLRRYRNIILLKMFVHITNNLQNF